MVTEALTCPGFGQEALESSLCHQVVELMVPSPARPRGPTQSRLPSCVLPPEHQIILEPIVSVLGGLSSLWFFLWASSQQPANAKEGAQGQIWIQNCRQQAPCAGVAPGAPDFRTEIVHEFLKDKASLQLLGTGGGVFREHVSTPFPIFA